MNLCLRLNQLVLIRSVRGVCSFQSLVVYFLPREMTTIDKDFLASSVEEQRYKQSVVFGPEDICKIREDMH